MYEKILVPLDGSDLGELILPYIEELGKKFGSELILLHVCPPKPDSFYHKNDIYIKHIADMVKKNLGGVDKVKPVVLPSKDPGRKIVNYAKGEDVNLIAMMTHGLSGLKRWAFGSVVDKVIRGTNKPVLLVRAGTIQGVRQEGILNKVLVPLDRSKLSEAILPYVEELALGLKGELTFLNVTTPTHYVTDGEVATMVPYSEEELEQKKAEARAYLEQVGAGMKAKGVSIKYESTAGSATEEIIEFADKVGVNLIAMSTHGSSGFKRWALGSVADRVLHHGSTPLLLLRPTKTA